jgi:hypothetical protein
MAGAMPGWVHRRAPLSTACPPNRPPRLGPYLDRQPLPFDVYTNPSAEAVSVYKMDRTPQTLILSSSGHLERVWRGAFAGPQQAEVERYFGVRLPQVSTTAN